MWFRYKRIIEKRVCSNLQGTHTVLVPQPSWEVHRGVQRHGLHYKSSLTAYVLRAWQKKILDHSKPLQGLRWLKTLAKYEKDLWKSNDKQRLTFVTISIAMLNGSNWDVASLVASFSKRNFAVLTKTIFSAKSPVFERRSRNLFQHLGR